MIRVARLAGLLPLTAHLRLEDTLAQFAAPLHEQVGFFRVSGIILHLRVFRAARATCGTQVGLPGAAVGARTLFLDCFQCGCWSPEPLCLKARMSVYK